MEAYMIGQQIAKYRKKMKMTQEELGQKVGVSTQAVSRWECGGTPDVVLLPTIADVLNVSIDALFGREGSTYETSQIQHINYIKSLEGKQRYKSLVKFIFDLGLELCQKDISNIFNGCLGNSIINIDGIERIADVEFMTNEGTIYGVYADDLYFMSIFPDIKEGYQKYFLNNDSFRELFKALAQPYVMEILLDLASDNYTLITVSAEAIRQKITNDEARHALESLSDIHVLRRFSLDQGNGIENAYVFEQDRPIVQFLMFATLFFQSHHGHLVCFNNRDFPVIKKI